MSKFTFEFSVFIFWWKREDSISPSSVQLIYIYKTCLHYSLLHNQQIDIIVYVKKAIVLGFSVLYQCVPSPQYVNCLCFCSICATKQFS